MTTYLFHGYGTEYTLHFLYLEMVKRGYKCIEWEMSSTPYKLNDIREMVSGSKVVLITSGHFSLDRISYKECYPKNVKEYYSPLEIIQLMQISKSIFIPHDLDTVLILREHQYLSFFDYYFSPFLDISFLKNFTSCIVAGWIKNNPTFFSTTVKEPYVWLFGNAVGYIADLGEDKICELAKPLLELGVSIKLPNWPGNEKLDRLLRETGFNLIDCNANSSALINNAQIVFTNGCSSVVTESYLSGKPTINLTDFDLDGSAKKRYSEYKELNFLKLNEVKKLFSNLKFGSKKILEFDLELAVQTII